MIAPQFGSITVNYVRPQEADNDHYGTTPNGKRAFTEHGLVNTLHQLAFINNQASSDITEFRNSGSFTLEKDPKNFRARLTADEKLEKLFLTNLIYTGKLISWQEND